MSDFRGQNDITNYEDFILQPKPANPPNTLLRLYADSSLGALSAINSLGTSVLGGSSGSIGTAINVKVPSTACPACSAVGDAQYITDGVTGGSGGLTLTSASANFKSTDVGKFVYCNFPGNGTNILPATTKITSFNSATSVQVSLGTGNSGLACVWYTQDDTAAFQAAVTAALVLGGNNNTGGYAFPNAKTIYIPPGGYVVSKQALNIVGVVGTQQGVSILGDAMGTTTIFTTPSFSFSGINPNLGFVVNMAGQGNSIKNLSINGGGFLYNNSFNLPVIYFGCTLCLMENVGVFNFGLQSTAAAISVSAQNSTLINTKVQGGVPFSGGSNAIACTVLQASGITWVNPLCSNFPINMVVSGLTGSSLGSNLTVFGGIIDECGVGASACTQIGTSIDVNFVGTTIWSTTYAMSIDGTSIVRASQCFIGPYDVNTNAGGLTIASGGQLIATESQFGYSGTAAAINGPAGAIFNDVGGNKIVSCNTIPCTPIPTTAFATHGFTGGINPIASLTHTWNTCYETTAGFVAATLCNQYLDQNVQLTRIKASSSTAITCATSPVVTITDGVNSATLSITTAGSTTWDSGALTTLPFTAGNTATVSVTLGACATPPTNFAVTYNMQSVLNV